MPGPSHVGTLTDPMKGRVLVDEYLNEVKAGDTTATFVFKPADLERVKARRTELGLGTDGQAAEAARVQRASRVVERDSATRRAAALRAEADALDAAVADDEKAAKAEAKADKSAKAGE